MPKVTSMPAAATSAALRAASRKPSIPRMAWSEASTSSTAPSLSAQSAATATAAAVLRPAGSSTTVAAMPTSASWSLTRNRCASLQITIGAAPPETAAARSAVSCSSVLSVTSGRNCLGRSWRDTGHSRLPAPPQRITGRIAGLAAPGAVTSGVLLLAVDRRVERGIVVHLELAVDLEAGRAARGLLEQAVEARGQVASLLVQAVQLGAAALDVGRIHVLALDLQPHVVDLERQN